MFSAAEQQAVVDGLTELYRGFDVNFTLTQPSGDFTRIVYDGSGLGGIAVTGIDFRNTASNDLGFVGTSGLQSESSARQVNYAINVGGHELGHTLGLRHHDSFGAIGNGVPGNGLDGPFFPDYPGPTTANEFFGNTMSTPAFGGSFERFFTSPTSLSERSLVKLGYAAQDDNLQVETSSFNNTIASAQAVPLDFIDVLNTLPAGTSAGDTGDPYLPSRAGAVLGSLSSPADVDVYSIDVNAGDFLSVEVISLSIDQRVADTIDGAITIFDAAGNALDYYGEDAFNEDEIETFDAWIFDLIIPADGTYFVEVDSNFANNTGDYEVFFSSYGTGRIAGDANGDGTVDLADFLILRSNFNGDGLFSSGDFNGDQ
ncbi:MAG: pre-peptidase C-terminal domain-containing protein, partial [Planctomycetota bacterium]